MEILHCRGQAAFILMRQGGAKEATPLPNNTPVKTGVL